MVLCVCVRACARVCVCVVLGAGVTAVGSRDGYPDAVNPFSAPCPHPLTEVW